LLFDNLDSALADINALQDYNLDHLIKRYKISFQYSSELPKRVYGFSLPYTNTMFVSQSLEHGERVKAHELIHCLVDDSANPLVESSTVNNSKIESRADWGGLYLMIKEYQSIYDVEPESFDIIQFCEYAYIPDKYVFMAANVAEKVFNINIPDNAFY